MTHQLLGFGRDLFLIAGGVFFGAFFATQLAKRKYSAATIRAVSEKFSDLRALASENQP
jgi:hypothetical protein